MSKVAIVGDASGTGTFTISAPNGNTNRTLVLPDEAGTVLTSASPVVYPKGVPAFRVYANALQSISNGTFAKIQLNTKTFDVGGYFDNTTNYRYTPSVAGYYQLNATVCFKATTAVDRVLLEVRKNGTSSLTGRSVDFYPRTSPLVVVSSSFDIDFNGSDYVELFCYIEGSGTLSLNSTDANTSWFSGHLVSAT